MRERFGKVGGLCVGVGLLPALGTGTPEGNLLLGDGNALGQVPDLVWRHWGVDGQVGDRAAVGAKKVGVFAQVGAIAGRLAFVVDHAHLSGGCECFEAVVNGC